MKCHSDAKHRASLKAKGAGLFKCQGICKNDRKCTRTIRTGEYCWQHQSKEEDKEEDKKSGAPPQLGRCAICLDDVTTKKDAGLVCGHSFHLSCVKQLRNNLCPICRRELKSKKLKSIDSKRITQRKEKDRIERESTLGSISGDRLMTTNTFIIFVRNNPELLLILSENRNNSEILRERAARIYSAIMGGLSR